jgi:DNA-binding transcriptional LysR family regulator
LHERNVNLTDLETFVLVASTGSMTAAAAQLAVPKSTVSRRIRRLERDLDLPLVHRSPNRIRLTRQGVLLRDRCAPALDTIERSQREIRGLSTEPAGLVRVTTLQTLGYAPALTTILLEYRQRYPRVELELLATDRVLDFDEASIDLAIRPVQVEITGSHPLLSTRILGRLDAGIYASPGYIERHGRTELLDRLGTNLRVVHEPSTRMGLDLRSLRGKKRRVEVHAAFRTTSFGQVLHAALGGATVGVLPTFLADPEVERGNLVPLFEEWRVVGPEFGLVHPADRLLLPKTRALIELLEERATPVGLVSPV